MAELMPQRGRILLRAASAITLAFVATGALVVTGCSPSMDSNLETTNQTVSAQSTTALAETDGSKPRDERGQPITDDIAATESARPAELPKPGEKPQDAAQGAVKAGEATKPAEGDQALAASGGAAAIDVATANGQPAPAEANAAAPEKPAQKGLFGGFFAANKAGQAKPQADAGDAAGTKVAFAATAPKSAATTAKEQVLTNPSPQLSFETLGNDAPPQRGAKRNEVPQIREVRASFADDGEGTGLPGVRQSALFEIKRKSGIDDDSDVDIHEDADGGVQLASAGGMARLSPNGLLKQRDSVDVACLKPSLIRVIRTLESKFGKKAVITSGYRSASYNRSVRGAKNSQHMFCAAVDMQIPGVSKWQLANAARSMQGRGGVGTYCHTESVHIDVGPERDWNWRCRGRRT